MVQDRANAVIIGAGIAGASIAYHLAKLGRRDIVVVEQGELISGTTSHAPGLVGQLRSSVSLMTMLVYSVSLPRTQGRWRARLFRSRQLTPGLLEGSVGRNQKAG